MWQRFRCSVHDWRCILCCQIGVLLDDVVVGHAATRRCICLRCYTRVTESGVTMDHKELQKLVEAAGRD